MSFFPARSLILFPVLIVWLAAGPAPAVTFDFPGSARIAASRSEPLSSYLLPLGPWSEGNLPVRRVEGAVDQTAWTVDAPGLTTLELLVPLRDQLAAQGFAVLWECDTSNCGGFDFLYGTNVLPEPDMHVDLGDFRFLAAERQDPGNAEVVSLMVSRSASQGFVQVMQVSPPQAGREPSAAIPAQTPAEGTAPGTAAASDLGRALEATGAVALDDLTFATGSARLEAGRFGSLEALAAFLADHALAAIMLVGHTDASGDLVGNIALSKARATSVRDRLIADYGVAPSQIMAEGVGYLAPRASNQTGEGRTRNRRVEALLMVPR